ncbi:MAG: prenyltransferase [Myxococcales bacterium]|nr:prenyltransferase [Myxococcales bacterium]
MGKQNIVLDFLRQSRVLFLTCTLVPVSFGGALAYYETGRFDWLSFALCLLGVSAAHLGVNLSNDYFDFRSGADRPETGDRPYSGGGDALTRDRVDPHQVRRWFWSCFLVAAAIGLVLFLRMDRGRPLMLAIAVLGFIGGYFYTAPPLRLAYRGLGELDIFLFLGPAPALGTFVVLTGEITWRAFWLSLPIAGLITLLLWINQYTDFETDRAAGKKNLVVRLGKRRARWGYAMLNLFVFGWSLWMIQRGWAPLSFVVVLLALPLSIGSVALAIRHYDDEEKIRAAQADALMMHLSAGLLCSLGLLMGCAR